MPRPALRHRGLSHVEALVALALLAVALVPAMQALTGGVGAASGGAAIADPWLSAQSKMEEVLARPFAELDAAATAAGGPGNPSSYSEASGTPGRRIVYLSRYDGDNADGDNNPFTGTDAGLLWVKVAVEATPVAIETLTAVY